jgi:heme oxygenase
MQSSSDEQPFDIFHQLKEGTSDIHQRVEERVAIFDAEFDLVRYVQLLERFYGFWAPVETKLSHSNSLDHPALDLQSRLKSHLLAADLLILGSNPVTLPLCGDLPPLDTFSRGLGCLYVLEGSTLGARVISRRIESHLHLRVGSGASFFNAYGEAVGRRWVEFKSFLTTHATPADSEEIVNSARQAFHSFFDWLGVFPKPTSTAI